MELPNSSQLNIKSEKKQYCSSYETNNKYNQNLYFVSNYKLKLFLFNK